MNITCRPLGNQWTDCNLEEIAGLIYDTDPYIYPALFESRQEALTLIPRMIHEGDAMFSPDNLFVAESDSAIVGIILWHKGPLQWNDTIYRKSGGHSLYLRAVSDDYFSTYQNVASDTISIINFCVTVRRHGVGTRLLQSFLDDKPGKHELFVLTDNSEAIHLYQKCGFSIAKSLHGFSIEKKQLPCYQMIHFS